jgi:hypothetical protein
VKAARVLLAALGIAVAGWGAIGLLRDAGDTRPFQVVLWVAGGLVAHDLVLAPVVAVVAWLTVRFVPSSVRPVVQAGLLSAGVLALIALPLLLRSGSPRDNASVLPRDYGTGTAVVLALVGLGTAVGVAVARIRVRRLRRD